jgi:membrane protease YdiL (CAAX protease family)
VRWLRIAETNHRGAMSENEPLPDLPEHQSVPPPLTDAIFAVPTDITRDRQEPASSAPADSIVSVPAEVAHERPQEDGTGWAWAEGRWVQRPRKPHPNFWWSILWCLGFLFVTQIISGIIAAIWGIVILIVSGRFGSALANSQELQKELLQGPMLKVAFFLSMVLGIGFSWLALRLMVGRDWPRRVALRRPSLAHTGLALLSVPAFVLLANLAYEVLRKIVHVPSLSELLGNKGHSMEEMVKLFGTWPWPLAVLLIGVGPGLSEELWCRGFLGHGLVGRYGPVLGIVFTSFFFGLIHVDPAQGSMALLMGLWLHFVYLTTRSLWVPMLLHFLNNSLSVIASHFAATQEAARANGTEALYTINASALDLPVLLYVGAGLLLLAVGWALYQSRARLAAADGTEPAPWQPPYPGVDYPPPGSGTRVAQPLPSRTSLVLVMAALIFFVVVFVLW